MPLTEQHSKEYLSLAYVYAIAGMARVNMGHDEKDYGVDGSFQRVTHIPHRRRNLSGGIRLNFQLKATTNAVVKGDAVVYDLESKTYNDFAHWAREEYSSPTILLLLRLPEDWQEWIDHDEERLLLRRCCYYHKLLSREEVENENSTKRIFIPTSQVFTAEALHKLFEQAKNGVFYEDQ